MNRAFWLGVTTFLCLIGISLCGNPQRAIAGHGCHGCYGWNACDGCHNCWGADCGGFAARCHGWHGCWGRRHCYGVVRVYHGYYGCHGCGGCHGCAGAVWLEKPADEAPQPPPPAATPAAPDSQDKQDTKATPQPAESALLHVRVPADAKVIINGQATHSAGAQRQYASFGLRPGLSYRYEVLVEVVRGGKTLQLAKTVELQAKQTSQLQFQFDAPRVAAR